MEYIFGLLTRPNSAGYKQNTAYFSLVTLLALFLSILSKDNITFWLLLGTTNKQTNKHKQKTKKIHGQVVKKNPMQSNSVLSSHTQFKISPLIFLRPDTTLCIHIRKERCVLFSLSWFIPHLPLRMVAFCFSWWGVGGDRIRPKREIWLVLLQCDHQPSARQMLTFWLTLVGHTSKNVSDPPPRSPHCTFPDAGYILTTDCLSLP